MTKLCSPLATHLPLGGGEGSHGLVGLLDLGIRTQERQRLVEKSVLCFFWKTKADSDLVGGRSEEAVDSSVSRRGSPLSLALSLVP